MRRTLSRRRFGRDSNFYWSIFYWFRQRRGRAVLRCPSANRDARLGEAGLELIKGFEGCAKRRADARFDAYPDPATGGEPWMTGWSVTSPDIAEGLVWTEVQVR